VTNKYLEKIAALNPTAKVFAQKVMSSMQGNPSKINNVYNATSGILSKKMKGVYTSAEKTAISGKIQGQADKIVGPGKLYSGEAVRAARAGARLARMQSRKVA
jgi:hypothetical protein